MLPQGLLTRNTGYEENFQKQVSPGVQDHASNDGDDRQPEILNGLHAAIWEAHKHISFIQRVILQDKH